MKSFRTAVIACVQKRKSLSKQHVFNSRYVACSYLLLLKTLNVLLCCKCMGNGDFVAYSWGCWHVTWNALTVRKSSVCQQTFYKESLMHVTVNIKKLNTHSFISTFQVWYSF